MQANLFNNSSLLNQIKNKISEAREIGYLDLNAYRLNDSHIEKLCIILKDEPNITSLSLKCNMICDQGAQSLAKLTTIERLDLDENSISDASALVLAKSDIKELILSRNNFHDKGANIFAKYSKQLKLNLDGNQHILSSSALENVAKKISTNNKLLDKPFFDILF